METIEVNGKEYITYRVIETSAFTMELRLSLFPMWNPSVIAEITRPTISIIKLRVS